MDVLTMKLMEREINLPLDILIFINEFIKYEKLNNENMKEVVDFWFENKEECKFKYGHISYWNTSNVTDMCSLFYLKRDFNEDISRWNVSNVTTMYGMFNDASSFRGDISGWNVSNVTNMGFMFRGATYFNCDISNWNVSNVANMRYMFSHASSFNSDISGWNVSKVTTMYRMFYDTSSFNSNLNNWKIRNHDENHDFESMKEMFKGAKNFNINNIIEWGLNEKNKQLLF